MGETHTEQDRTYKCVVGDGSGDSADNKVQLQGRPQGKMNISNVFTIIPEDFLVVAELTIEKKVLDQNGQQTDNKRHVLCFCLQADRFRR